ncbi:uncharacterized protein LOC131693791 [Topomyia yanbarensis]|uniref:uncharacterized protein LOC131693791 n=1 Tax=Topomyia yanbarensis TaxID=2498891 RepID=UPI00273CE3EA|nr:uncharacterized protein LOC131693791 [Topomyia yanbarensis]
MSSGHKHLYSCVTFIVFMIVINFYKNKINQAREREAFVRAKANGNKGPVGRHALQLMTKHRPLNIDGVEDDDNWFEFNVGRPSCPETVLERMKEFPDECMDMEVFYFSKEKTIDSYPAKRKRELPIGINPKASVRRQDTGSNSSMYVFLSVLIILLIAAAVDISKHIRDIPRQDNIRRLSLQNYQTLIREKQKQFRMMKMHYSQPSMSFDGSLDEPSYPSTRPNDVADLRAPAVKSNPLLRRQSVPAFKRTSICSAKQLCRRPSVDSFALAERDGDVSSFIKANNGSPTEIRRRVRLLHRH